MNRHDRRAARAKKESRPDSYERTAQAMLSALKGWLAANKGVPRFVFPPRDVAFAGSIDQHGYRLARDYNARELVDLFVKIGFEVGGASPTILMLDAILDLAGVPIERVSLEELGIHLPVAGEP